MAPVMSTDGRGELYAFLSLQISPGWGILGAHPMVGDTGEADEHGGTEPLAADRALPGCRRCVPDPRAAVVC